MIVASILGGLLLLFFGGEWLLRGSVQLAERFNLSRLFVSMVLVGFGTSMPELLVSTTAAIKEVPNLALGSVMGSNIANVMLILGLAAVLSPVIHRRTQVERGALAALAACVVLGGFAAFGAINRLGGAILVTLLIGYVGYEYLSERNSGTIAAAQLEAADQKAQSSAMMVPWAIGLCLVGIALLVAGAQFLVDGATQAAVKLKIPDAIIGLTLVALGTSLPELATVVVAAYRKHTDVVLGNVIGSNLFNILGILGVTGLIAPIPFVGRVAQIDIWVTVSVAMALYVTIWTGRSLGRVYGALSLTIYGAYVVALYANSS